jgi:hypothetical protein
MLQNRKTQHTTGLTIREVRKVLNIAIEVAGISDAKVGTESACKIVPFVEQMPYQPNLFRKTSARPQVIDWGPICRFSHQTQKNEEKGVAMIEH